jgi:trk system potassium uptake protein TrkH
MARKSLGLSGERPFDRLRYGGAGRVAARWQALRATLAVLALATVTLREGWREPLLSGGAARLLEGALLALVLASYPIAARLGDREAMKEIRSNGARRVEVGLALVGLLGALAPGLLSTGVFPLQEVAILLLAALHGVEGFIALARRRLRPGLIFVLSFALLIVLGAGALMLPAATPVEAPLGPLDALFTATSAVCVTGLIVRDTASEFTRFGQTVILALIQLGGLGILFFGALLALAVGSSLGLRAMQAVGHAGEEGLSSRGVRRLLIFIALATMVAEAAGAAALYFGWPATWEGAPSMETAADRVFHSVFFSVSAFCNAGFATSPNSVEGLRFHWTSLVVVCALITLGGLGFPALDEARYTLWRRARRLLRLDASRAPIRMSLHARLVLTTSLCLYLVGVGATLLGRMTQGGEAFLPALADAHFLSVTARTAGFDTVAPGELGGFSRFAVMFLMFIGGSPGSTAGGVKTIALAVMLVSVWATIRGRPQAEIFRRAIPDEAVKRAATLIVLGLATIVAVASALIAFEGHRFEIDDLIFEAVSACGTVGLSTGVTPGLGTGGKIAVIAGMFLGRVGPLAVLVALVSVAARRRAQYAYPTEPVQMS